MSDSAWVDSAIRGAAIAAVAVAFGYFRKRFPVRKGTSDLDEFMPVSGWWTFLAVMLWIAATIGMTLALVPLWRSINAAMSSLHGPALVVLLPTDAWWYLYSGFSALSLSWYLVAPVQRALMSPRHFAVWEHQQSAKAGFDSNRAFRWIGLVIMVPYTVFFVPSLGCHTRFTDSDVAVQDYAALVELAYPYHEVKAVALVRGYRDRKGEFHQDPHISIRFADGRLWTTRKGFRDPEPIREELVQLLESKVPGRMRMVETDSAI